MDVLVAGGHGQVARRLLRILCQRGHVARGLIRDPDHAPELEALGAVPVLCDLERDDPDPHVATADAVVFAAGAGPGSGPERKRTVDFGGAVTLIEAARRRGGLRYVMVSSVGADAPEEGPEPMRPYLRAKAEADAVLRESRLPWTIVRPGRLTNAPGNGRVDAAPQLDRRGEIPRDDVALVLAEVLEVPATAGLTFEVLGGSTPVHAAVRGLAGAVRPAGG